MYNRDGWKKESRPCVCNCNSIGYKNKRSNCILCKNTGWCERTRTTDELFDYLYSEIDELKDAIRTLEDKLPS